MPQRQYFVSLIKMNVSSPPTEKCISLPRDRPRVSLTLSVPANGAILLKKDVLPWQLEKP